MDILKVLDVADKLLTIAILLVGAIGFFFRTWISEWIKNRFSRAIHKELETQKHQLNIDLEAYKGSLIRELEQFKANIDIKRSIALKMADARLDALRTLTSEVSQFTTQCCVWPQMNIQQRLHSLTKFNEVVNSSMQAHREAGIFIPLELNTEIAKHISDMLNFTQEFRADNETVLQSSDQRIADNIQNHANISQKLREQIFSTPAQLN